MERIGEYQIKRLVGEGGMGKVYEAEERLSKRRVALKILRPELTRHEEGRRLFLNEMQILARVEHPSLVRSLASIEHEGQLVLVLEFLEGKTLRETLADGVALPWTRALNIAIQVAGALGAAHSQEPSIVHRDLKPENIMLLKEGGVKVMDFGVAKVLEGAAGPSTQSIGTLQYMSPEQIDARPIDGRSDLYALGLVLFEMLTGEPPFRSSSPRELLNLQCTAAPPDLDVEVPQGVEAILLSLLAKSPDARPKTAAEVLDALGPFRASDRRAGKTPVAKPATPSSEPMPSALSQTPHPVRSSSSGTLHSRPAPKTDTIALLDRPVAPRELSSAWAVLAIVGLSLAAGLGTYGVRVRARPTEPIATPSHAAPSAWAASTRR